MRRSLQCTNAYSIRAVRIDTKWCKKNEALDWETACAETDSKHE